MATDNPSVQDKTSLLQTQAYEQVKQHIVFDSASRPQFVFTAGISAKDNDPCTCTEYVYLSPMSTLVVARQERKYKWKAAWDANFIFDPTADYDPDGDGTL